MANGPTDVQNTQAITWLEEQRRADQHTIATLSHDVERLASASRAQETRLLQLVDEVQSLRQEQARISIIDDNARDSRETIDRLSERTDHLEESVENQRRLRATDVERDRKQLNETATGILEVTRQFDALSSRIQSLGDEQRHDRGRVSPIPEAVAELDRRLGTAVQRVLQVEEGTRRYDNHLALLKAASDASFTRVDALEGAQKLTDVRWNRLLSDWQQQLERWRGSVEEATRPVGQLGTQLGQLRTEISGQQTGISDTSRRVDELTIAIQRLDSLLGAGREHTGRVELTIDAIRRRLDETVAAVLRLEESVSQRGIEGREQSTRLDNLIADLKTVHQTLIQLRAADERAEKSIQTVQQGLHVEGSTRDSQTKKLAARIEEDLARQDALRLSLLRTLAEQRRREMVLIEREIHDLSEGVGNVEAARASDYVRSSERN